jgi:DNA-binding MarR family transcriptional regulator
MTIDVVDTNSIPPVDRDADALSIVNAGILVDDNLVKLFVGKTTKPEGSPALPRTMSRQNPLEDTSAMDLVEKLTSISKLTRALLGFKLAEIGLHNGQDELLMLLQDRVPIIISALARELSVRPPTVSKMIDRLEASGFVERRDVDEDRRRTSILITATGLEMRDRVRSIREDVGTMLTATLDAAETDRMMHGLDTVEAALAVQFVKLR